MALLVMQNNRSPGFPTGKHSLLLFSTEDHGSGEFSEEHEHAGFENKHIFGRLLKCSRSATREVSCDSSKWVTWYICLAASCRIVTSRSAIAERPRDARVTSIRKIAKWNF